MSLFSDLKNRFYSNVARNIIKDFSLKNPGPLQKWAADLLGADETSVSQPYRQSIWVYRCIQQWLAVAQVPLLLKDQDGNDVTSGPLAYLVNNPKPGQSTNDLIKWLMLSLGLRGEFFLLREDGTNFDGIPIYLSIVWPSRMSISHGDINKQDESVKSWTLSLGEGLTRKIDPRGVIHMAFPNPYNSNRGLSPVEAAMASIESDNSARQHNKYQMDRHGRITGLVSFKDSLGPDQMQLVSDLFREKYEGKKNAGKTAFLDNGATMTQLSMAAKDMDWAEGLSITREEICAAYGISTIVAGGLKGATFSNYEMAMKAAWNDTLIPIGASIADTLNRSIVKTNEPSQYVEFDFKNAVSVLQEDENKKIDRYIKLLGGKMTPKQAATLAQIDLGDPNPAHDVVWIGANEMPADAALAVPELPKDVKPVPAPAKKPEPEPNPEPKESEEKHIHAKAPSEYLQARGKSILKTTYPYERKLELMLKRFFYDQRKAVLANTAKALKEVAGKSVEQKAKAGTNFANQLLGNTDWNAELRRRVKPTLLEVAKLGGKQILKDLGGANRFELASMDAFMSQQTLLLDEVQEYTREALIAGANDILEGVTTGETLDETIDKLQDSFKGIFNKTEARRRTIARTETLRSLNGGRMEQMKDVGVEQKQWLAIMDANVRDSHAALNEVVIPLGDSWTTENGIDLEYPLDPSADPSETINCFPGNTLIVYSPEIKAITRRMYKGRIVTLKTKSGHILTGTINHPVLTSKGWQALGCLCIGDSVFGNRLSVVNGLSLSADVSIQHPPSTISEIFDSLYVPQNAQRRAGSVVDFHGDGKETDIEIVCTNGLLKNAVRDESGNVPLSNTNIVPGNLLRDGSSLSLYGANDAIQSCGMGGGVLPAPFSYAHATPLDALRVALASSDNIVFDQYPSNDVAGHIEVVSNDILRNAGEIIIDDVVSIESSDFHDYVYNLQTVNEYYCASSGNDSQGIIAHNCRCVCVPVFGGEQ